MGYSREEVSLSNHIALLSLYGQGNVFHDTCIDIKKKQGCAYMLRVQQCCVSNKVLVFNLENEKELLLLCSFYA